MKRCPFCAEEIQDAAIVCKHCGRDVPPPPVKSTPDRPTTRPPVLLIILGGIAGMVIITWLFQQVESRSPKPTEDCRLHARAAVVDRETPIAQLGKWSSDVLAIRSADANEWSDLEVTIWGFLDTPVTGRQPSGPYTLKTGLVGAGALTALKLYDFTKPTGEHWISMTMKVDTIKLKASMRGVPCEVDITPGQ